ncbi:MAG: hypothetical protein K2P49_07325 [Oscillospiraceae bacterium]|nr:hypothetical protein [Oscillospiraceae bacterium]
MKKILSLTLCLSMLFTLIVPSYAIASESDQFHTDTNTVYLSDEVSLNISIIDNDNSDSPSTSFEILQFNNGQLVRKVTLSDDGGFLLGTEYNDGAVVREYSISLVERIDSCPSVPQATIVNARSAEYVIGYITFNPLIGETTSERLKVYCNPYFYDTESYVVNGKAADAVADVAGILFSIFISYAFPAAELSKIVAEAIISFFGGKIIGNAIGVNFTEKVAVESYYYSFRSYKLSAGIYSSSYSGISRRVTTLESTYSGQWFHEGTTPSTWKDGNVFAVWCWNEMYGEYCPGVKNYS